MSNISAQIEDRVIRATPNSINREIEMKMWSRVASVSDRSADEISDRIKELEEEWDIERYLGVNMSTLAMSGLVISAFTKNINWLVLPGVVLAFFMQHAIQGWCPPLPILRKLHIRTSKEIEQEKYALKFIRGDFNDLAKISKDDIAELKMAIKRT